MKSVVPFNLYFRWTDTGNSVTGNTFLILQATGQCVYDWIHERIDQSSPIGSRGL